MSMIIKPEWSLAGHDGYGLVTFIMDNLESASIPTDPVRRAGFKYGTVGRLDDGGLVFRPTEAVIELDLGLLGDAHDDGLIGGVGLAGRLTSHHDVSELVFHGDDVTDVHVFVPYDDGDGAHDNDLEVCKTGDGVLTLEWNAA